MAQEEKKLLLVDLCARLPYGVIAKYKSREKEGNVKMTYGNIGYVAELGNGWWKECKPYLRPMSSMTEEECDMVEEILGDKCIFDFMSNGDIVLKQGQFSQNKLAKLYDYYASIHVDYRGLIQKGLALEAPEKMYNLNK